MSTLSDFQFELDGYLFGLGLPVAVDQEGFDPGTAEWTVQDQDSSVSDVTAFGRDRLRGPTWAWDMFVDAQDTAGALAAYGGVARVWRNEDRRTDPGSVSTLRYCLAGRTRRIYGRPRRFAGKPNNGILNGTMPIVTDFKAADAMHYDDEEQRVVIPIVPNTAGGLTAPLTAPLMAVGAGAPRAGLVAVGGDSDAPLIAEIHGPVTSPWVASGGWRLEFPGLSVAYDKVLRIDTYPWSVVEGLGATIDGASVAGQRSRASSYFDEVRLAPPPPGEVTTDRSITFGGIDTTGTASCTVRWRSTWASL